MNTMIVHARISENDLSQTGVSPNDLAKAIQIAIQNLKHAASGEPIALPSPVQVLVEGDGPEMRCY
jgi:hypothetical protein